MINPKIFNAVLMAATKETKDAVLKALVHHIGNNYDYNDNKVGHIVDMLVDKNAVITPDNVDTEWLEAHLECLMYRIDEYNIKNISVESVDNIDCTVRVKFEYLEKINEDNNDITYTKTYTDVSFNDHPKILK